MSTDGPAKQTAPATTRERPAPQPETAGAQSLASEIVPAIVDAVRAGHPLPTAQVHRRAAVLELERNHGNRQVARLLVRPAAPAIARATDQHEGAAEPTAAQQTAIAGLLNPTSTGAGGVSLAWDGIADPGKITKAEADTNRAKLKTELTQALEAHLKGVMPGIKKTASLRRLPMTSLEGAGKAAKQVTDKHFGNLVTAAALTPGQATQHGAFDFKGSGPGQNLFDAYDPAQRKTAGHPIDPDDLSSWIAETDGGARKAATAHNFNPRRSGTEQTFLRNEILKPFVSANKADLEQYDTFGFAISGTRIVVPSSVDPNLSDTPGKGGEPSPAERAARWSTWKLLVHEYIHTLEHPKFTSASGPSGNRIMREGFCELFTKDVLTAELPGAPTNAALAAQIEGGKFPAPDPAIVGGYSAGEYAFYLDQVEQIRDKAIGGTGGDSAVKAAFFQGHVELLGLTPTGGAATPSAGANMVTVPPGVKTVADLASASGVSQAEILKANTTLTASGPLPSTVAIPGCRDHVVVEASGLPGQKSTVETKDQIATQNGVTTAHLEAANPGRDWTKLAAGQRILIPLH